MLTLPLLLGVTGNRHLKMSTTTGYQLNTMMFNNLIVPCNIGETETSFRPGNISHGIKSVIICIGSFLNLN